MILQRESLFMQIEFKMEGYPEKEKKNEKHSTERTLKYLGIQIMYLIIILWGFSIQKDPVNEITDAKALRTLLANYQTAMQELELEFEGFDFQGMEDQLFELGYSNARISGSEIEVLSQIVSEYQRLVSAISEVETAGNYYGSYAYAAPEVAQSLREVNLAAMHARSDSFTEIRAMLHTLEQILEGSEAGLNLSQIGIDLYRAGDSGDVNAAHLFGLDYSVFLNELYAYTDTLGIPYRYEILTMSEGGENALAELEELMAMLQEQMLAAESNISDEAMAHNYLILCAATLILGLSFMGTLITLVSQFYTSHMPFKSRRRRRSSAPRMITATPINETAATTGAGTGSSGERSTEEPLDLAMLDAEQQALQQRRG